MFHGGRSGCTFEGTEGTIYVDRGRPGIDAGDHLAAAARRPAIFHLPAVSNSHHQNWLDCIRSRRRPVADVEIGARTAQVCPAC